MKLHRRAEIMECRGNVQDLPAMLLELRKGRATDVERAFEIDIDDSSKTVWRQLLRCTKKVSRCAIHNEVDLPKLLDSMRDCFFNFLRLSTINSNRKRLPTI